MSNHVVSIQESYSGLLISENSLFEVAEDCCHQHSQNGVIDRVKNSLTELDKLRK